MVNDIKTLLPHLIQLVEEASEVILDFYQRAGQFEVHSKRDQSPLTQADLASHEVIFKVLMQLTPHIPVLSEEGDKFSFGKRQQWSCYWLVDPLDGTKEFIGHTGEFSINIALIENNKPVLGIVYSPVLAEGYVAYQSGPCIKIQRGEQVTITTRQWQSDQTVIAASHSSKFDKTKALLQKLEHYDIIRSGSAIKFGWVAEGKADLYARLGDTYEWDTAAGQCIVEQAGGYVVDLQGHVLRYNTRPSLLNPHFLVVGDKRLRDLILEEQTK